MEWNNVLSVASKDFETYRRKRSIIAYTFGVPLVMSAAFSLVVNDQIAPNLASSGITDSVGLGLNSLMYFFVVFAAVLPTSLAAYSIVGEKVEKSLEPMLATPLSDEEILLGKTIASLIPPLASVWIGALIFMTASDHILGAVLSYAYFPNLVSATMLFVLAPLASLLGVLIAVIASSRINDVRGANQLAGLVWIPFMVFFIYAVQGIVQFTLFNLLIFAGTLGAIEVMFFFMATSTFKREQILTKWR